MPILEFRCENCASVFEHLVSPLFFLEPDCISCGGKNISRVKMTYFYPNKIFCPHDKDLDSNHLQNQLGGILKNTEAKCGGCGTDGAPGKCNSGGSCGSGSCGCSSGRRGSGSYGCSSGGRGGGSCGCSSGGRGSESYACGSSGRGGCV